ncbi:MAG: 8-oxo-dGTP pyrophosphatase MutT (NUDIX family) [Gammaproteobacteria bacterium]|jgi:8-oxo-dGTP pyrophosphatase MutT (NUDIX family)
MSFLDRIEAANQADLAGSRRFIIDGEPLGWVNLLMVQALSQYSDVFRVGTQHISLVPSLEAADVSERTQAVAQVTRDLYREGLVTGWRDELNAVISRWGEPAKLCVERASAPCLGITGFGVHMNGYVRRGTELFLWVAKRAHDKPTYPGELDQLVAGGQPAQLGLLENLIKECDEEAGISAELAARAKPAGMVSYATSSPLGLRPDVLFVFDLELPSDFTPRNNDGEVESFELWPVSQVLEVVSNSAKFKYNCALVVIDFLIRHGAISPELNDYGAIVAGLRGRESFLQKYDHGR